MPRAKGRGLTFGIWKTALDCRVPAQFQDTKGGSSKPEAQEAVE